MALTSPTTVRRALTFVASDRLLLPGIQRSFVWRAKQIEALFDSLLRGYPIGWMLLWTTRPAAHPQLRFLRVVTDHKGKLEDPPKATPKRTAAVHAVLDGQQRLTALNIGLRGSLASSPTARTRRLYLDLDTDVEDAGSEDNRYRFAFRTTADGADGSWFPVSEVLGMSSSNDALNRAISVAGLSPNGGRRRVLRRLVRAVNEDAVIRLQTETGDLDRVLNVFARINKGGTPLSYVELLVGTATAKWDKLNARDEITDLRRSMNDASREPFDFSADRIVKAGLVLVGGQTKFHVESFLTGNTARRLEDDWPRFRQSMEIAARLLDSFGLSGRSLPAQNVVIPLAYYAHHRKLRPMFVTAHSRERDRALIRAFVARTMLTRGYWTGAVDPVLVACRTAIRNHGATGFPLAAIERALAPIKPIDVDDGTIEDLLSLRYGDRRTVVLLRLLFPHMVHHGPHWKGLDKDHVFPRSRFERARPAGMSQKKWTEAGARADLLPNLQLLRAEDNRGGGKVAVLPRPWLQSLQPSHRKRYTAQFVRNVPANVAEAPAFWDRRREELRQEIASLLTP